MKKEEMKKDILLQLETIVDRIKNNKVHIEYLDFEYHYDDNIFPSLNGRVNPVKIGESIKLRFHDTPELKLKSRTEEVSNPKTLICSQCGKECTGVVPKYIFSTRNELMEDIAESSCCGEHIILKDVKSKDTNKPTFENKSVSKVQDAIEQFILDGASQEELKRYFDNFKDTKENNMNEWKDLDIGNIPPDMCTPNIEIRYKNKKDKWKICSLKPTERGILLNNVSRGNGEYQYRPKPLESKPIIIKSGDTWVAEYKGVDYLCVDPKKWDSMPEHIKNKSVEEWWKGYGLRDWKPISEIKITDDIAKLRPMVTTDYLYNPCILWAIDKTGMSHYETGGCNVKALKLATVKDLTTK